MALKTLVYRFWSKVLVGGPNDCWEWTACRNKKHYGVFNRGRRGEGNEFAHRMAWILTNGETRLCVLHTCDNPPCCNPAHLFEGTKVQNNQDKQNKGRQSKGSHRPLSKLSEESVFQIRSLKGLTNQQIAEKYGVSRSAISLARSGRTWRHVENPNV